MGNLGLVSGGRRLLTWKKVVTIDLGGWLITQAEGPGRYSTCANVVFLFS